MKNEIENKAVKIGNDNEQEREYLQNAEAKLDAYRKSIDLVLREFDIKDLVAFQAEPLQYVMDVMESKTVNEFPAGVSLRKRLEMLEFPLDEIRASIAEWLSYDVEVDYKANKPLDKDFGIWLYDADEIARYNICTRLIAEVETLRAEGVAVNYNTISQGVSFIIGYSQAEGKLMPNIKYIKQLLY